MGCTLWLRPSRSAPFLGLSCFALLKLEERLKVTDSAERSAASLAVSAEVPLLLTMLLRFPLLEEEELAVLAIG